MTAKLYKKPQITEITPESIDDISLLLMSGGGPTPPIIYKYVYILLTSAGAYGMGHSALLMQNYDASINLYSFSPDDNESPYLHEGKVAWIDNTRPPVPLTFAAFAAQCYSSGVHLYNGITRWVEPFDKYIRMAITSAQWNAIATYALGIKYPNNPVYYNVTEYNCMDFVVLALATGNVVLRNSAGVAITVTPRIPNTYYFSAAHASGTSGFTKGIFHV